MKMTWAEVCARRLARHGLAERVASGQLVAQVGVMCGAHAQVMSAAELSISVRVDGATQSSVRDALWQDHTLIKTYGPRGTIHLLPAQDLAMWTGALLAIPHIRKQNPKNMLMTPDQTEEVINAIADALKDAELTIDELTDAIVERTGSWAGDRVMDAFQDKWARWREATDTAAYRGVLCFGANKDRKITYTNPRRWLPKFRPMDTQTALAGIVKQYLYAYGPATSQQFAKWLNVPLQWTADLFASLTNELQSVEVDGVSAWLVAGDTERPAAAPQGVRLLPYFDAYVIGCHPRDKVFPGQASKRALAGGQAGNFPVLLIDGVAAGVWHHRKSGRKVIITVEPLEDLNAKQYRELDAEVERVGAFLEGTPQLTIGKVTVGAHA
jgi:hypothetical protein